jgi:iron complex outermembrane receptor protein
MKLRWTRVLAACWIALVGIAGDSVVRAARYDAAIAGKVLTSEEQPAEGVTVQLVELHRQAHTDASGSFRFDGLAEGRYVLQAAHPRFGAGVMVVEVGAGAELQVEIRLDRAMHHEEIVVSAGVGPGSLAEVGQPVAVLDREELTRVIQPTLGETLAREPGVSSTSYAPGTSRPVIRGLGGDRIRIMEDGVGIGDVSNVSPDHAVSFDPLSAERVEIVRGPAMLLYGTNAVAGVVNIDSARIPDHVAERALGGDVMLRGGTSDDAREGSLSLQGGAGQFGWHVDANKRRTDDLETPDFTVTNSEIDSEGGGGGVSWIGEAGHVGVSYGQYDSLYGIAVEEEVTIDLEQRRIDLEAERTRPFGPFRSARFRLGSSDYEHVELEGTEVGTTFETEALEGRVELVHEPAGSFTGRLGLQYGDDDFSAVGEEAFIAPAESDGWAVFAFEEVGLDRFRIQLGARFESQDHDSDDPAMRDRSFDGGAGSAGLIWLPGEAWSVAGTLARSTRFPTTEELYSNGVHVATQSVEFGDDDLGEETSWGLDLALRRRTGKVTGELTLFAQRYEDFIFDRDTGTIDPIEGLPVFQYTQLDAEFSGAELHVDVELLHREPHHLHLELLGDTVRAELRDSNEPLPRIPPRRYGLALLYQGSHLWARVEGRHAAEQDRVAPNETVTDDHTLIEASAGYRFFVARQVHEVMLRGSNLTDEVALNHVSRFKEIVPLPGRDISLIYRWIF